MSLADQMDEDLDAFFDTNDFAVSATFGGDTITVILDQPFNAIDEFGRPLESADISIVGRQSDLSAAAIDDPVVIGATTYYVCGPVQKGDDARTCRVKLSLKAQHG